MNELERLQKKLIREQKARKDAEELLETKSRELYLLNQSLLDERDSLSRVNKELNVLFEVSQLSYNNYEISQWLQKFIDIICSNMDWHIGHVFLVKAETLQATDIWHLANLSHDNTFVQISNSISFDIDEGLPGKCLASGKSIWIDNMFESHGSPRTAEIVELGLKSAFATPIKVNEKIYAIAEFFLSNDRAKDDELLALVDSAANQVGILISNNLSNIEIKQKNQRLSDLVDELQEFQLTALQSEKMASIGQLAAGVAHEINNPVSFVSGNVDIIAEYTSAFEQSITHLKALLPSADENIKAQIEQFFKEEDIDFIQDDLNKIIPSTRDGIKRIRDIVNNLKSFARSDSTEQNEDVDINECIQSTLKIVMNELKYHCEVELNLADNLPTIKANGGQLNQVILNLLVNAGQAIEENGHITVCSVKKADHLEISVKDSGKGIPQETIEKIFDPFFTTKPVGKGTGLGLSVSYGIIERHGGRIQVESTVGEGTEFTIILPLERSA